MSFVHCDRCPADGRRRNQIQRSWFRRGWIFRFHTESNRLHCHLRAKCFTGQLIRPNVCNVSRKAFSKLNRVVVRLRSLHSEIFCVEKMSGTALTSKKSTKSRLTIRATRFTRFGRATRHGAFGKSRKTLLSDYTMHGHFIRRSRGPFRRFEPTYRLESQNAIDIEHVNFLVRMCTLRSIDDHFPKYNADSATTFADELGREIRMRLKLLHYDRYRIVVVVNVVEKLRQSINSKIGFLWEHETDLWTTFRHETPTFIVNVIVCGFYWN